MAITNGFINRVDEIDHITALLERIDRPALAGVSDVYLQECVVNLHGPPGIGKSALLKELHKRLGPRSAALLIDLRFGLSEDRLQQEKLRFIAQGIWALEQLPGQGSETPDQLTRLHEAVAAAEHAQSNDLTDQALTLLVHFIQRRAEQQVILLLIDSCEHASEALFAWIERHFLLPLIHNPEGQASRTLCVFASQILLRWRQHNVRRRVKAQPIGPLSLRATQDQVGSAELGDVLYQLTYGHALANTVAIAYLQNQRVPAAEQLRWLRDNQQQLITMVVEELRRHATESMLGATGLPEGWERWDLWEIIEPLSVLREFDLNSMRVMLEAFHERFQQLNQSALLVAIRELLRTRLVEWSSLLRAYQIAPAIRQIFARALALHQPDLFKALRQKAVEYYESQIRTVPGNRHLYLIEYMFQRLSSPETTPADARRLETQLGSLLAKYYANASRTYLDHEGLEALERSLADDEEIEQALIQQDCPPWLLRAVVTQFRAGDSSAMTVKGAGAAR